MSLKDLLFKGSKSGVAPQEKTEYVILKDTQSKLLKYDLLSSRATAIHWKEVGSDTLRTPEERTTICHNGLPFSAAGRTYLSSKQLRVQKEEGSRHRYRDCYGRNVFHYWERFPIFDPSDFCDDRCYNWYFICENGILTRVYHSDEMPNIYVTEDVAFLEDNCWEAMEKEGFPD